MLIHSEVTIPASLTILRQPVGWDLAGLRHPGQWERWSSVTTVTILTEINASEMIALAPGLDTDHCMWHFQNHRNAGASGKW